ncbi:MAG: hypothetical protein OEY78_07280 [Gammaproteobacteria bacterium]|nr:hypothetical protein [Gammaproteobacteria bacterium]
MKKIALQISPEAKAAYFSDFIKVAKKELLAVVGDITVNHINKGSLNFFELEIKHEDFERLLKLSFVQGIYAIDSELLQPLDITADFPLHDDFIFGSKFKGKTNERLTQMLINVGLATINAKPEQGISLLDPMCGRATTLLWAMQYGIKARGIEQDPKALEDIHRNLKKWTKLHRQKHKISDGFIGGSKKNGKFIDFTSADTGMRVVNGDARNTNHIFKKEKFDLLISDLPYGVQHFTTDKTRNPLSVIKQCIDAWKSCLKKRGAIVLAFNSNNPKRNALIEVFESNGFQTMSFSAPHRMSESIIRDVIIFKLKGTI